MWNCLCVALNNVNLRARFTKLWPFLIFFRIIGNLRTRLPNKISHIPLIFFIYWLIVINEHLISTVAWFDILDYVICYPVSSRVYIYMYVQLYVCMYKRMGVWVWIFESYSHALYLASLFLFLLDLDRFSLDLDSFVNKKKNTKSISKETKCTILNKTKIFFCEWNNWTKWKFEKKIANAY